MTSFAIGAATVTRIEETYEPNFDAAKFFPDWRAETVQQHKDWMLPHHYDASSGSLKLSVHSWLVRVGGRTILIDTCVGNGKARPTMPKWHQMQTGYLDRLAEAGVRPDQIDMVMCTHLHSDHVGWNTRLDNGRWRPTFPNARYVFSKLDYEYYRTPAPEQGPASVAAFHDSVLPVVEAGLAHMVSGTHQVDEHISLDPAPGHTPGTVAITLASRGERALFSGDILHHAIQVHEPTWNSVGCVDGVSARTSRRKVLEECAGTGGVLMPAHFGIPFACHVDAKGNRFVPRF